MPINLPNGNDVEEIVLPNGANASEVYGPNGKLVWEGTAIPDSVVHRWPMDEGSGSTIEDAVGSADGTINGPSWTSGTWIGGFALVGDGVGDYIDLPVESYGGAHLSGGSGVAFTFQTTNKDFDDYFGVANSSDGTELRAFTSDTGQIAYLVRDSAGDHIHIRTDDGLDYSDGNTHRAVLQKSGSSASDFEIAVDGSFVNTTIISDNGPLGDFTDFEYPMTLFARRTGASSVTSYIDATIDEPNLLSSNWDSTQVQNDYDRQPWS